MDARNQGVPLNWFAGCGRLAANLRRAEVRRKMCGCTLHHRRKTITLRFLEGGFEVRAARKPWAALLVLAGCAQAQPLPAEADRTYERSSAWVRYYAERYQLQIEFVEAIIDQESAWNPHAVSKKGAVGLMQLMPDTARRFGVANRFRIEQNIQGGMAYLAWLKQQFNADLRLVTAAYYVGEAPIRLRGLAYANPDVHTYVSQVAQRYRARLASKAESTTHAQEAPGR